MTCFSTLLFRFGERSILLMTAPTQLQHPWPYLSSIFRTQLLLKLHKAFVKTGVPYNLLLSYQCVFYLHLLNLKKYYFRSRSRESWSTLVSTSSIHFYR